MPRIVLLSAALMIGLCAPANAQKMQQGMQQKIQQGTQSLQPDSCGAAALQSFVGKPKAKLPVNLPQGARVLCSTCAATMDYNPSRLDVIYDTETGVVTKVKCG